MPDYLIIPFIFVFGACVGSFLNVVVWRLPRDESIVSPPSHCPKCLHRLAWRDNIPVLGWILLGGKCRYCGQKISSRYPIIEFITGALLVFYYVMFFIFNIGPCAPQQALVGTDVLGRTVMADRMMSGIASDWPMYALYTYMIASLLAVSLIDAELFIIPPSIPWILAALGVGWHAIFDHPRVPGAVSLQSGMAAAIAMGSGAGLLVSIVFSRLGWIPASFVEGEPALEIDIEMYEEEVEKARRERRDPPPKPRQYTVGEIRREICKEMAFLLPPMLGALAAGAACLYWGRAASWFAGLIAYDWVSGMLGAILGAIVGGGVVWLARILGTLAFGRVAMGLGDADLMFGVGAVVGAGAATVTFFLAPFAGLVVGIYRLLARGKWEMPYGPYLALATGAVVLIYCPIAAYFAPGMRVIGAAIRSALGA